MWHYITWTFDRETAASCDILLTFITCMACNCRLMTNKIRCTISPLTPPTHLPEDDLFKPKHA